MAVNRHDDHDEVRLPELERPGLRHETSDVNVWAIGKFGLALAVVCVLSLGLLFGMFKYFQSDFGGPARDMNVDARKLPPQPQLQKTPMLDLQAMRAAEDQILTTYAWVDESKGIVRVPIDQAIDALAKKGLPSRAPVEMKSDVSMPTESGLGIRASAAGGEK